MKFFNHIVKRVANFSVQSYEINKHNLYDFYESNELFKICVLTASKSLYNEIEKAKTKKTESSLYNYFARAHMNPTPFGVFNSVGLSEWGKETSIFKSNELSLFIKYDNLFLSTKISEEFEKRWRDLKYFPNPTIHFINENKIGFYKSVAKDTNKDKIEVIYNEIDFDEDLNWLLNQFQNGKKIEIVIQNIEKEGFEREEIEAFLRETIESGVIIENYMFDPYTIKQNNSFDSYFSKLIDEKKHNLNTKEDIKGFRENYIKEIEGMFQKNEDPKNFYAINSFDFQNKGILNTEIQNKINQYINFVVQYNSKYFPINEKLTKFINKANEKYNDGFIPLLDLFNPYSGISYLDIKTENDIKLHEDILSKIINSDERKVFLNLSVEENTEIKSKKLPATFTVVLETLTEKESNEPFIYIRTLGYQSALAMISRFNDITHSACQEIIKYEKEVNSDKIIAEINCIGTFRSVNISSPKQQYDFSLPINCIHDEDSNAILLSDIYAHIENGTLSLVSKTHKKQILPKKVTAINPRISESDIYNFLSDYELYNQEIYPINFDFNSYSYYLPFIPRVYLCEGILLYPAQLMLVYKEYSIEKFHTYLKEKLEQHNFTQNVIVKNSYNEVVIDTNNHENLKKLQDVLKEKKFLYVLEYIYEYFSPNITNEAENFAHELVIGVQNPYYKRQNIDYNRFNIAYVDSQQAAVISDWLYLELYCKSQADSEIFSFVYNMIILKEMTDQFFFINYSNPERHLRFRFKTKSIQNKEYIINIIKELKSKKLISKYQILPYNQETYRYGWEEMMKLSEVIFDLDSRDFLENVTTKKLSERELKIIAVLKMRNYLYFFNFTLDNAIAFCEESIFNFSKEFKLTSELRKEFNSVYSDIRSDLTKHEYETFFKEIDFKDKYLKEIQKVKSNTNGIIWATIHMSMNRHFNNNQRFCEFEIYYLTKCYLNQLKFSKKQ